MKKIFLLIIVIFSLLKNKSSAQENYLGSWNILNVKYNIDEKWILFGEAQLRSLKMYDEFNYYEYKGGINYKANKNLRLTFGAGSHQTYKSGGNFITPKKNDDFRLWPQIVLLQSINRIEIEQRYRAEWRFTGNGNLNRFRYRLGFIYPFGKKTQKNKPFNVNLSNEIFLTNKMPYFERNRLLMACNYKISTASTFQLGLLHQFDFKLNDETGTSFLVVGYYFELFKNSSTNLDKTHELKDN